jgi:hypothetical protein
LSEGYAGPLATSEKHFYGLDTLPLFIAIAIYVPFWPGRYIRTSESRIGLQPQDEAAVADNSGSSEQERSLDEAGAVVHIPQSEEKTGSIKKE